MDYAAPEAGQRLSEALYNPDSILLRNVILSSQADSFGSFCTRSLRAGDSEVDTKQWSIASERIVAGWVNVIAFSCEGCLWQYFTPSILSLSRDR